MYGGANTVVLPRDKRFKISDNVSLPLFGEINLHLPDFFVIKMKRMNCFYTNHLFRKSI